MYTNTLEPENHGVFLSLSMFGSSGSAFGQSQQNPSPFGGQAGGTSGNNAFGFGTQNSGVQNSGSQNTFGGFGAKPSTPSAGGLFGSTNQQSSSGLFGQSNNQGTSSNGLFGNNNNTAAKPPTSGLFSSTNNNTSGGLFGNSNQNNSTASGGGLFGNSNNKAPTANGGLFGSNTNPATNTSSGGLLSNTSNSNSKPGGGGLFGNTSTNTGTGGSSGLFGNTNTTNSNTGGGLFGSSSINNPGTTGSGGGLFGQQPQAPPQKSLFGNTTGGSAGSGLFGSANTSTNPVPSSSSLSSQANQQQQSQPSQQGLVATVDQASYTLQGVTPTPKLYTSLSVPVAKRSAQDRDVYNRETKPPVARSRIASVRGLQNSSWKSSLKPGTPTDLPVSLAPSQRDNANRLVSNATHATINNEPRKWINSYEAFIRDRPTTLVIDHKAQAKSKHLLLPSSSAPVATAPPVTTPLPATRPSRIIDTVQQDSEPSMSNDAGDLADPDVSLFHRQANNMTVVQVDPKAIEQGYYVYPRLEVLASMSKSQLTSVSNLVIGRENYGQIEYPEPVDLSLLGNLGDILGKLVIFEAGIVCVYPDQGRKAPRGRELNLPATVSIENAWPKDAETHAIITNMEDKRMTKHISRLRKLCEERGAEFVTFMKGVWVFRVPHFSTWGLPVDDMIVDDNEVDEEGGDNMEEDSPVELPVVEDPVVPQVASSPILGALDEKSKVPDIGDGIDFFGGDHPQTWLEQLSHAASGILLAKAQSLVAASKATDKLDLGDILMPTSPKYKESLENDDSKDKPANKIRESPINIAQAVAVINELRPRLKVTSRPGNDLPLLRSIVDFTSLSLLYPSKKPLWQLLSILYEAPKASVASKLSSWFDETVKGVEIGAQGDSLEKTWKLLGKHEVAKAYSQASDSDSPHLAMLVSMLAEKETRRVANLNAQQQLSDWKATGFTSSIPVSVRRIWELAAGKLPSGTGLKWEQWLGIHLWYMDTDSIESAVRALPSNLSTNRDPALAFLQFYSGSKQLRTALGEFDLLESFLCLQALFQIAPETVQADRKCYDSVCLRLSEELQQSNDLISAVFVALHVTDSKSALNMVRKILCEVPSTIELPSEFAVQDAIVHEARAFQDAKKGEYRAQCDHLVRAGMYKEAHKVLLAEVGPNAVLSDQMAQIKDTLLLLDEHRAEIPSWDNGGGAYLKYAELTTAGATPDNYSVIYLCNACRYIETPTLESREAVSRISEWVASTPYAMKNIQPETILGMKFAPSQARIETLDQAAHLLF